MPTLQDTDKDTSEGKKGSLKQLLTDLSFVKVSKKGEILKGCVLSITRAGVKIDIDGLKTGVVRGPELFQQSDEYANLKVGDEVEATVVDPENENGDIELSFRDAGQKNAWKKMTTALQSGEILEMKVADANRGGLMILSDGQRAFLPVSQLNPDHYPRVTGGDKNRILDKLREYVGQTFKVKVIDVNERENKLIVSEKAVWEDTKKDLLVNYKTGDIVDGVITALTTFGAFISFDEVEGLIHISEIAWQRIDHPKDVLKTGDKARAQIIQIDGPKIFLSIKRLIDDPWKRVNDKYAVGNVVKGTVIKINPFGLFVELDPEIHGLAHVSELSDGQVKDINTIARVGDKLDFEVISVEPKEHRLGLRLAGVKKERKLVEVEKIAVEKTPEKVASDAPAEQTSASSEPTPPQSEPIDALGEIQAS
ncbi:MAG: RNA binding S1 domain protein [Candidatus Magasanikbacteria bacterium GW2011_GWA2_45_39]|uniref:RNA binding S1 domain protein n=2 Tax=Candidatus Magasanikiibacteriota TaxID=1752731 RepID=A0A0G1N1U1_9BACT|nr:MAG: RNA binding S1 domain protein [Candidatus Magasanikbacteria bacterium GW2011_GWA2_45_39]KKU14322.1 MAG: RNA binding S1 domain protein [Candidatus Magasanikbacteria bacterium GW2011_GWC2_45_8]